MAARLTSYEMEMWVGVGPRSLTFIKPWPLPDAPVAGARVRVPLPHDPEYDHRVRRAWFDPTEYKMVAELDRLALPGEPKDVIAFFFNHGWSVSGLESMQEAA